MLNYWRINILKPKTNSMSEKSFVAETSKVLSNHFTFFHRVKGNHFSGKKLEIDCVIKPKQTDGWKNIDIAFGLEFKDMSRLDGIADTKEFSKWIAQCVDYSNTDWEGFGYIHILTCPGISSSNFINSAYGIPLFLRVLGHFGIGELKETTLYGWSILLHEQHRIWSEKEGVSGGKLWNLKRKFGSR